MLNNGRLSEGKDRSHTLKRGQETKAVQEKAISLPPGAKATPVSCLGRYARVMVVCADVKRWKKENSMLSFAWSIAQRKNSYRILTRLERA